MKIDKRRQIYIIITRKIIEDLKKKYLFGYLSTNYNKNHEIIEGIFKSVENRQKNLDIDMKKTDLILIMWTNLLLNPQQ